MKISRACGPLPSARGLLAVLLFAYAFLGAFFFLLHPAGSGRDGRPGGQRGLGLLPAAPARLEFRLVASVPSNAAQAAVAIPEPPSSAPSSRLLFAVLNYYGTSGIFSFRPPWPGLVKVTTAIAATGAHQKQLAVRTSPADGNSGLREAGSALSKPAVSAVSAVQNTQHIPGSGTHGGVTFTLGGRTYLAVAQFSGGQLTIFESADPSGSAPLIGRKRGPAIFRSREKSGRAGASGDGRAAPGDDAPPPVLCRAAFAPAEGPTSVVVLSLPHLSAGTVRLAVTLYTTGKVAFFDVVMRAPAVARRDDASWYEGKGEADPGGGMDACPSVILSRLPADTQLSVPGAESAVACALFPPRASPRRLAAGAEGSSGNPSLILLCVAAYYSADSGGWSAPSVVLLWDPVRRIFSRLQDFPTTGAHGAACFRTKRGASGLAWALARDSTGRFRTQSPVFKFDWRSRRFVPVVSD